MTQLEQAIETIKDWERDIRFPNDDREAIRKDTLCEVLDYLTSLPSLPEGLGEAAKESADKYVYESGSPFPNTEYAAHNFGFKAGAEWMAGQGVTMICTAVPIMLSNQPGESVFKADGLSWKEDELDVFGGDKVIVQIRKK